MNRLKELRLEAGLSMRQLTEEVDIDCSTIAKLENGIRQIHTNHIKPLCDFFGVTSDYLLGLSDEKKPSKPNVNTFSKIVEDLLYIKENGTKEDMNAVMKYVEYIKNSI